MEFHDRLQTFYDLLSMVEGTPGHELILVPDTNALISAPDVAKYAQAAGSETYTIVIVPTVLSELDKLKVTHRDADFREKVNGVIRRLKSLRTQRNMQAGVTVNRTVTVRMIAHEPTFKKTLSWLDPSNADDRIIASVIEIQQANPTAVVIVVTGDINLQNKAEMAGIPFVEIPNHTA